MLIINSTLFSSCLKLFRLSVFHACAGRLFHRRLVIYSMAGARGSSVMSECEAWARRLIVTLGCEAWGEKLECDTRV